ncbi:MAG: hypothetical protein II830_02365 [Alphaproteobacteria bacterium]|nr:hypothetical protein [Alphaproteobacteria bacterium]
MIYSISQQKEIPVTVTKQVFYIDDDYGELIRYTVHDASERKIPVGYVDLQNTRVGARVSYIKNQYPDLYKHFGQVADQIEVEHCLNRGIETPYIDSVAAMGTHIMHFKRGKRFINEGINVYLDYLIKNLKKGEHVLTGFLGYQKMYMPINLLNEIKEKIKINSLLKGVK